MHDLPPAIECTGWEWERFTAPGESSYNFWAGIDRDGNRWLTKLKGGFYAYREKMFAVNPWGFDTACWWNDPSGCPSDSGRALALEVCSDLAALSDVQVQEALSIPAGISFRKCWPIAPKLKESRRFAVDYVVSHAHA